MNGTLPFTIQESLCGAAIAEFLKDDDSNEIHRPHEVLVRCVMHISLGVLESNVAGFAPVRV